MNIEKLLRENERLRAELANQKTVADYQYDQACKYSAYAEMLETALDKIEAVQQEGYECGDGWKVIREIIANAKAKQP